MADFRENAGESIKKGAKKIIKIITKPLKKFIIIGVVIFLIIISLVGSYDALNEQFSKNVSEHMKNNTVQYNVEDNSIVIDEEQIKLLEDLLKDMGTTKERLHLTDENLKKIYAAEVVTQEINRGVAEQAGKYYGRVYVKRAGDSTAKNDLIDLTYTDLATLEAMEPTEDVLKYFSVDEGQICFASLTSHTDESGNVTNSKTIKKIPYKNQLTPYMMPVEFLLDLALITENPDFVMALADKVLNSGETEIIIAIMDEKITTTNTVTEWYNIESKTTTQVIDYDQNVANRIINSNTTTSDPVTGSQIQVGPTSSVSEVVTPVLQIAYVKSWFIEQEYIYNKDNSSQADYYGPDDPSNYIEPENFKSVPVTSPPTEYWENGNKKKVTNVWKYERKVNHKKEVTISTDTVKYVQGATQDPTDKAEEFLELLKKKYKKPETFIEETIIDKIVSGSGILLRMLQSSERTQAVEHIIRYTLYLYTGNSYGVTELDLNIFSARPFNEIGSGTSRELLVELIHYFENAGGPPTNADGTKYIIEDDGAGNLAVGYGVDIYNGGFAPLFEAAGYTIALGEEVDKEFVDNLEKQEIDNDIATMKSLLGGLNLTDYQINAMVSRSYNCGTGSLTSSGANAGAVGIRNGKNFVEAYNSYWNEETDNYFKTKNSNANFSHQLYTQYLASPTTSGGEYMAGLETRRRSEWTLFQTGYYNVLGKWHTGIGTGGITTDEEAVELENYINTELISTQRHSGSTAGFYQSGPFAKWWSSEGGNNLSPFQCTWWAYGRASMYLEQIGSPYTEYPRSGVGNGGEWYDKNIANGCFNYGSTPKPNSIISWKQPGNYGHVAYVEGVTSDGIYISHAGSGRSWFGIQKISLNGSLGSIWGSGSTYILNGYIYLDEPR